MDYKQVLAQLEQQAGSGEKIVQIDSPNDYIGGLAYSLNTANEIIFLGCFNTEVNDLSPLSQLTSLQQLNCDDTKVNDLSPLSQLTSLQHINFSGTQVNDLSPLSQLTSLQTLYCAGTQVNDLSPLSQLTSLQHINFSRTQVNDFSPLSQLTSLQHIDFGNTDVRDLSPISQLTSLQKLYCSDTLINDLSPLTQLASSNKLEMVDADGCNIINLPHDITALNLPLVFTDETKSIRLRHNPIENPPIEVIKRGNEAVESYFDSLKGETKLLNEVKIILVGEGAAGKTSIVKQLIHNDFDESECMTDGIEISSWAINCDDESIKANVWDFGGQEIMRATHQLFLSKRCIYLLVLDGRKDERPEHWLKQILSVGGNANILIVRNKIDENPDDNLQRQFLKEKYPQIVDFFPLSCKSGDGIAALKSTVENLVINLPMRRIEVAENWLKVKQQLASWSKSKDYIGYEHFVELCDAQQITTPIAQEVLLDLLHDLGLVIHFSELKHLQTQVLNPRWITEGIYALITSKELTQQKGLLSESEAEIILKAKVTEYSYQNKVHYLMRVMEQFELCYKIAKKQYLIPSLLPVELTSAPPAFGPESIQFVYKYEGFMPPQVMPRFIVKSHKDINDKQCWRTGVVLHNQHYHSTAKIVADNEEREITVTVSGGQCRDYFAVIRHNLNEIHNSYEQENLGLHSLVVVQSDQDNCRVKYDRLIKLEQRFLAGKGSEHDFSEELNDNFSVVDVLNGLESSQVRQEQREKTKMGKEDRHGNINVNVNPSIHVETHQKQDASLQANQQVSISIEIKSLSGKLENWAEDLIDELPDDENSPKIEKEVAKLTNALNDIKGVEDQSQAEEKISQFSRVADFISETIEGENKTGKFLKDAGTGIKKLQTMGKQYNNIAAKFGFPVVPEILL